MSRRRSGDAGSMCTGREVGDARNVAKYSKRLAP
jgi:hypothetical protein